MKRLCRAIYAIALAFAVAVTSVPVHGQTLQDLERNSSSAFVNAVQVYIYGYPLLMFGVTGRTATTVQDAMTRLGSAPLNQFGKEMVLPDSTFTGVVLPSTTTLYTSSFLNLKTEPVILHLPSMGSRFFLMQMLDGWTEVSPQSPGSRLTSPAGDYALVGPDWKDGTPDGISSQNVIHMPTNSMWIIGRIYTNGEDNDIDEIKNNIYPTLTLTPYSAWKAGNYVAPSDLPLQPMVDFITPPLAQVAAMDACASFASMAAMMQYNPPIPEQDDAVLPKLKQVGIMPGSPFDCTMDANRLPTLQLAVAAAKKLLQAAPTPRQTTTGWTVSLDVGTYGDNYLLRAEVAQDALGANNPQDAVYGYTQNDGRGKALDPSKHYKIHFDKQGRQGLPPIDGNGFWSLTIYDGMGKLVPYTNGMTYNAIGVPYVQKHHACFNGDGSLDLYLQATPPTDATALCNWLQTPSSGPAYIAFLRMYWPDETILNRRWVPPPIVAVN